MRRKQMKIVAARYALLLLMLAITASAGRDVTSAQKPASDAPAQQQGQQETPPLKLDTDLVSLSVTMNGETTRACGEIAAMVQSSDSINSTTTFNASGEPRAFKASPKLNLNPNSMR